MASGILTNFIISAAKWTKSTGGDTVLIGLCVCQSQCLYVCLQVCVQRTGQSAPKLIGRISTSISSSLLHYAVIWEDTAWNCWSRDQVDKYVRISSAREWLMSGTSCQVILLRQLQSTCLRTSWMTTGTMWALKANWSFISLSTFKYRVR